MWPIGHIERKWEGGGVEMMPSLSLYGAKDDRTKTQTTIIRIGCDFNL